MTSLASSVLSLENCWRFLLKIYIRCWLIKIIVLYVDNTGKSGLVVRRLVIWVVDLKRNIGWLVGGLLRCWFGCLLRCWLRCWLRRLLCGWTTPNGSYFLFTKLLLRFPQFPLFSLLTSLIFNTFQLLQQTFIIIWFIFFLITTLVILMSEVILQFPSPLLELLIESIEIWWPTSTLKYHLIL